MAAAMHTMPPIISASTEYLGAVHPDTKKTAHVAMSVAMLIPLMGLEELPRRPLMRPATVTNRKPKTTTNTAAKRLWNQRVAAPSMGRNVRSTHIMAMMTMEPIMTVRMGMSL